MERQIRIAVVGDKNYVSLYSAAGARIAHATTKAQALKAVSTLYSNGYSVIFMTEGLFKECEEGLQKYLRTPYPVIIPVPDENSDGSYTEGRISANIKKAIGSDIT